MSHIPVLLNEVLNCFEPKPDENFIDATLGGGGHALAILQKSAPQGKILGIDVNEKAINEFSQKIKGGENEKRVILVHDNFANLQNIIAEYKFAPIRGILADLGFSSIELEESGRGFSFLKDEPLDMRYGVRYDADKMQTDADSDYMSAAEIINTFSKEELADIFWKYGEEKFSQQIARKVVESRKIKPIVTTFQLVEFIKAATPLWYHRQKIPRRKALGILRGRHPATKVFQALRIAVNSELENLEKFLPQAVKVLQKNGRLAIISFHSLEDRIVKNFFREKKQQGLFKILNKKVIAPTAEEVKINPRSRSAKLRAAIKL